MKTKQLTLTFNKSERVSIDGDLVTSIPDGYKYAKDGYGGNANWLYIVPEDYPLELDHIEAKPLTFGIVPAPFYTEPKPIPVSNLDVCKRFLLQNNALEQGVAISECICSEHCFFVYQKYQDSNDYLFYKIKGVLFAGNKLYQFHTFMNHDEPVPDDEDAIRAFELVSRQWMKHVVLTSEPAYKEKGNPEEVKATLDDLSRVFKMAEEKILPTTPDGLGSDLRQIYALIAALFYSKNGKQLNSSGANAIRGMVEEAGGEAITEDNLKKLLEKSNAITPTDIILDYKHERVLKALITLDKLTNTNFEDGLTNVHYTGVKLLLKTLCAETGLDYDLNAFSLECLENLKELFGKRWQDTDAYIMNDSTVVIRQLDRSRSDSHSPKKAKKKAASPKKENKSPFPVASTSHVHTELLNNTDGYAVRFISQSETKKDSSKEESQFRNRMTALHPDYPGVVEELKENADRYAASLISAEEKTDIEQGWLVDTSPIHALRSLLWTALSAGDSENPFVDTSDPEYWISMAAFIESKNYVNYKPWRKDDSKLGSGLIKNTEFKVTYSDYIGTTETESVIELAKALKALLPVIELYFDQVNGNADTALEGLNAMRRIVLGWVAFAYACNCPFRIVEGKKAGSKVVGEKKSWASLSEIKTADNGHITIVGNTVYDIKDEAEVITIPEGVEDIYYGFIYDWDPKTVKKLIYPSTFTGYVHIPDNIEEVVIQGDHDEINLWNHVGIDYQDEDGYYVRFINLRRIVFEGRIKRLGNGFDLFEAAKNLKELVLPEGLEEIEHFMVFENLYTNFIEHLYLPESLETVSEEAFSNAISSRHYPTTRVYVYRSCPALDEIRAQIEESKKKTDEENCSWVDHSKYPFELVVRESPWLEKAQTFVQKVGALYDRKDSDNLGSFVEQAIKDCFEGYDSFVKCQNHIVAEAKNRGLSDLANLVESVDDAGGYDHLGGTLSDAISQQIEKKRLEEKTRKLAIIETLSGSDDIVELNRAITMLSELRDDMPDADSRIQQCADRIENLKEEKYDKAIAQYEVRTVASIKAAMGYLREIKPYKDAEERLVQFEEALAVEVRYEAAVKKMATTDAIHLMEAKRLFEELGQYKDAPEKKADCEQKHTAEIKRWYASIKANEHLETPEAINAVLMEYGQLMSADYHQERINAVNDRCEMLKSLRAQYQERAELQSKIAATTGFFNRKARKALEAELATKETEINNAITDLQMRDDLR